MSRYSHYYSRLVGHISDADLALLEDAEYCCWEDIRVNDAESPEVRRILERIQIDRHHRAECYGGFG